MTRFLRNSMFGTLAGVSTTLGNFLSGLVVARLLGVDQAGTVAFAQWLVWLLSTVVGLGLPFTLSRYMPEVAAREGEPQARLLAAALFRPFLAVAVLPTLVLLGVVVWRALGFPFHASEPGGWLHPLSDPWLCLLIGLNASALAMSDYARGYLRGLHAFATVAALSSSAALLQIAALLIGSALFGARGAVAAYLVGCVLPLSVLRQLRFRQTSALPADLSRRVVRYARFRWASDLLGFLVWSRIEVFFLQVFWTTKSVGLFSVGMTLSNLAVQGPLMLTWALLPHLSEQHGRQDKASMRRIHASGTRLLAFLVFPACFGLAAVLPRLLPLLYGAAFQDAVPTAQILVCAASIAAVSSVGTNIVWAVERTDLDFYANLVGASVAILCGILLIEPFGAQGAAWSRTATQLAAVTVSSWFLAARLEFRIPFASLARLAGSALLCAVTAHLCLSALPGALGLVLAIIAGAIAYVAAVRAVGALEPEDTARLRSTLHTLPRPGMPSRWRSFCWVDRFRPRQWPFDHRRRMLRQQRPAEPDRR